MKKLIALALVLSLCAVGLFAQTAPSVTGDFSAIYKFYGDDMVAGANIGRLRLGVNIPVGDVVTVKMDLRDDLNTVNYLGFNQVYAVTNLSKALGLDGVALTLTGGKFEYWISGFNAATTAHRGRQAELFTIGSGLPALALDVGFDFGTFMAYSGFSGDQLAYKFGFKLGNVVEGLNAWASYSFNTQDTIEYLKLEAGYNLGIGDGMNLFIPASFIANLKAETNQWGSGLKFTGMGLTAAVEVGSNDIEADFLQILDFNFAYDVSKQLQVYAKAWMNPDEAGSSVDFFEALDLGIRFLAGANKIYLGYVIDAGAAQAISVTDDDSAARAGVTGGGLYLGWRVSF